MGKEKVHREDAETVAAEIMVHLGVFCEKWQIAGSIRRKKDMVSDIEILYIPEIGERPNPGDMFDAAKVNFMDEAIAALESSDILEKRPKENGQFTYGEFIKLMRHKKSGVAVDFFACTSETWWNNLVCRTGGKDSNVAVSTKALQMGYRWNSTGRGFSSLSNGSVVPVDLEEDVFKFVGLPFLPPENRA
jgi:DNA polymerase/3'-5' exonuclease PolX